MPSPTVTYTFTNSTVADADEVNTNFTDLINSLSDGTKDLSIAALTAAGAATFNGNVTLGNASSDDITFTGSIASTIPIKTTNTYNIGSSTLGLAGIYLGNAGGSTTIRLVSAASVSSSATYTIPDVGTSGTFFMLGGTQTVTGTKTMQDTTFNASAAQISCYIGTTGDTGTNKGIRISSNSADQGFIYFADESAPTSGGVVYDHSTNAMALRTNGANNVNIDSSGNIDCTGVTLDGGSNTIDVYTTTTVSINFNENAGAGQSNPLTMNVTKIGRNVTVSWATTTITAGSTSSATFLDTNVMSSYAPVVADIYAPVIVTFNGTLQTGVVRISSSGSVFVYGNQNLTTTWTTSTAHAIRGGCFSYIAAS